MASEATHSTIKNDQGQVTHYEIFVDGALVGTATKTDKGQFNFKVHDGAGTDLSDMKTMRELKAEATKNVSTAFLEANKPEAKPKKAAATKEKKAAGDPLEKQLAADDTHEAGEDINLC
jgi:hypothetical protein